MLQVAVAVQISGPRSAVGAAVVPISRRKDLTVLSAAVGLFLFDPYFGL